MSHLMPFITDAEPYITFLATLGQEFLMDASVRAAARYVTHGELEPGMRWAKMGMSATEDGRKDNKLRLRLGQHPLVHHHVAFMDGTRVRIGFVRDEAIFVSKGHRKKESVVCLQLEQNSVRSSKKHDNDTKMDRN
eukprot:m.189867 g.189867  ORF g.189867 m.189867 type:complete len:136 (+) comp16748_c0_seq5:164-571(+)